MSVRGLLQRVQGLVSGMASGKAKTVQSRKQHIGQGGENAAAAYVKAQGMRILYRNWRQGSMELDMVCEDAEGLVFVEVKTRKAQNMTSPLEGMTAKKCASLCKAARLWLAAHEKQGVYDKPCRFAVAAVTYEEHPQLCYKVEFYDYAFDFTPTYQGSKRTAMGGGNTPWQPW